MAQSNKKSQENASALVNSVGNLTNAISGLQLPETAMKLSTVAVTLFNQFKTAKDFKKRVALVELIVNGANSDSEKPCTVESYPETIKKMRDSLESLFPPIKAERISNEMTLGLPAGTDIEKAIAALKKEIEDIDNSLKTVKSQAEEDKLIADKEVKEKSLSYLRKGLEDIQKIYDKKIVSLTEQERDTWLEKIGTNFCGVIDILKLNMDELDKIQRSALLLLYDNTLDDSKTLLNYYNGIATNDQRVQKEIGLMLDYKTQREKLKELISSRKNPTINKAEQDALDKKIKSLRSRISSTLNAISVMDDIVKIEVDKIVNQSDQQCAQDPSCLETPNETIARQQLIKSSTVFVSVLEKREKELLSENARLIEESNRVESQYKKVTNDLAQIKEKQKQMNSLFETIIASLDTWGETHSGLRLSLNSKQPITAARLFSKAKEIFEILKPKETASN